MAKGSIELFSDYFAHETNPASITDARIKLVFTLIMLVLVLINGNIVIALAVAITSICALCAIRIPLKLVFGRFIAPLLIACMLVVLQSLVTGSTALFELRFAGYHIDFYYEGLIKGSVIAGRVIAGVALMVFLSMTTPVYSILGALRFFRVPDGWLEVMAFAYRYIFVFVEEVQAIMDSQRLRLGYSGLATSLRSWGILTGSLFIRAYDQAQATHEAMLLRGYDGSLHLQAPDRLVARDIYTACIMAGIIVILLLAQVFGG
ncbi:MAG TPA: cobalt ECF transporter T component CbiQ [Candidatus Aquicultor sp.]|jgi:cobalt/nickel transport system permease protein